MKQFLKSFNFRQRFFVGIPADGKVLDLGCGSGYNCKALYNISSRFKLVGVDLDETNTAPEYVEYRQVNLDRGTLPYEDGEFDAVIITHVLEHMLNPLGIGAEIRRVLKKGGRLYVETPNWIGLIVPSFGFKREQQGPFNFYDDPTHIKPWSSHGLYNFIHQHCEMRVISCGPVRNWLRIPLDPLIILLGLLIGRRDYVISSVWNIIGWAIYAIGEKQA